jgi:hypothetical protein
MRPPIQRGLSASARNGTGFVFTQVGAGGEPRHHNWAIEWNIPIEPLLKILEALDLNGRRLADLFADEKQDVPARDNQEPDHATRGALRQIAERTSRLRQRAYVFVNNRLEGNAPQTNAAVVAGEDA